MCLGAASMKPRHLVKRVKLVRSTALGPRYPRELRCLCSPLKIRERWAPAPGAHPCAPPTTMERSVGGARSANRRRQRGLDAMGVRAGGVSAARKSAAVERIRDANG